MDTPQPQETRNVSRTLSVGKAIWFGLIWVNVPVLVYLSCPLWIFSTYIEQGEISRDYSWLGLIVFLTSIVAAWSWWSLAVPRWRRWAYRRVDDLAQLKQQAIAVGITWPDDHIFESTECLRPLSAVSRENCAQIASRNWSDISYLKSGNNRQRAMHDALVDHKLLELLSEFNPVVVSTICLDIDTPNSDVDIICYAPNLERFSQVARANFGSLDNFFVRQRNDASVVCGFRLSKFEIELFASSIQVEEQRAYLHLVVTARLLAIGGDVLREEIRALKRAGHATEPAIAQILGLQGEPYDALAMLSEASDRDLAALLGGLAQPLTGP
ncbi:MAG: DUF4269 domain-containing protein [Oligoflexia bacterium]|nr:DUF4269 domain-containing protein [Oligoflexia bacterium]